MSGRLRGTLLDQPQADRERRGVGLLVAVGQAPSKLAIPEAPITGSTGRNLAELAGLGAPEAFRCFFDRVNLLREWPGHKPGGSVDAFDFAAGRAAALELHPDLVGRRCLLLGRNVGRCFGMAGRIFQWRLVLRRDAIDEESGMIRSHLVSRGRGDRGERWRPYADQHGVAIAAAIPHPSHVSHWWSHPANVERAERFLRSAVEAARSLGKIPFRDG